MAFCISVFHPLSLYILDSVRLGLILLFFLSITWLYQPTGELNRQMNHSGAISIFTAEPLVDITLEALKGELQHFVRVRTTLRKIIFFGVELSSWTNDDMFFCVFF